MLSVQVGIVRMPEFPFTDRRVKTFGGRDHPGVRLRELEDQEAVTLQLDGRSLEPLGIEGDLGDVEPLGERPAASDIDAEPGPLAVLE